MIGLKKMLIFVLIAVSFIGIVAGKTVKSTSVLAENTSWCLKKTFEVTEEISNCFKQIGETVEDFSTNSGEYAKNLMNEENSKEAKFKESNSNLSAEKATENWILIAN